MKSMLKGALGALMLVLALSGLTAASALAAGAPIVETKPATLVAGTSADLNGVVNPNGATTKYYFEYGPTTSYGSKTQELRAAGKVEWSELITGLATKSSYHFRMVGTNSSGTSYGADETFTTLAEKPEFVLKPGEKLSEANLSGTSGGTDPLWENSSGEKFACTAMSAHASFLDSKTVAGKLTFAGCKTGQSECYSEGAKAEEITTQELEGTLVYLSRSAKTVAILFKPKTASYLTKFNCLTQKDEVRGSILVPVSPVNKMQFGLTELALNELHGTQGIAEYEAGVGQKVPANLTTDWTNGKTFYSLGWLLQQFPLSTNKEIEIQA